MVEVTQSCAGSLLKINEHLLLLSTIEEQTGSARQSPRNASHHTISKNIGVLHGMYLMHSIND